mmetsp:Transcript_57821/g.65981  ORF Transcript_57821/g.65981 Transcript_57821/m.65981 type:complete len:243 (+) Transcript_57821:63-791(+)
MFGRGAILKGISKNPNFRRYYNQFNEVNPRTVRVDYLAKDITIRRYPWAMWIAAFFFIASACYVAFHLITGSRGVLITDYDKHWWWQYMLMIIFYTIGSCFLMASKIEKVKICKVSKVLSKSQWYPFRCKVKSKKVPLENIESIGVVRRGIINQTTDSSYYKVEVKLDCPPHRLDVLETGSLLKAKRRAIMLMKFLCYQNFDIEVRDETWDGYRPREKSLSRENEDRDDHRLLSEEISDSQN